MCLWSKTVRVFTPVPNGTFLAGITRARHMENMRADGMKVHESVLSFDDFHAADEVFLSGNMMKVTPISAFDDTAYRVGRNGNPVTQRVREMYWDWAATQKAWVTRHRRKRLSSDRPLPDLRTLDLQKPIASDAHATP